MCALILEHASAVQFFAPDYADARKYLPALLRKRGIEPDAAMTVLDTLERVVLPLEAEFYAPVRDDTPY